MSKENHEKEGEFLWGVDGGIVLTSIDHMDFFVSAGLTRFRVQEMDYEFRFFGKAKETKPERSFFVVPFGVGIRLFL